MNGPLRQQTRRGFLATATATGVSLSGCLGRFRRATQRDSPDQVSVDILAVPHDEDINSLMIANHLADNLETAGIDTNVMPTRHATFLRNVLINQDFDMYVWKLPVAQDIDFMRPLIHSQFSEEHGWQNPFGFSSSIIDETLEEQLTQETGLEEQTEVLLSRFSQEVPFIPLVFQEDLRIHRNDRIREHTDVMPGDPLWWLTIQPAQDADSEGAFRIGTTDWRPTHNLNPIAVEYRHGPGVTGLIYDPLVRILDTHDLPWLAHSWEWVSPVTARAPTMQVELRSDLSWHDGVPLTAEDVVFTYRFLQDTTMDEEDPTIPAPRFRQPISLLDSIEAPDSETIQLQFQECRRSIAKQLLTVPIFPEHFWEEQTGLTEVAGVPIAEGTTDALVIDNLEPIGSGPYTVEDINTDRSLELHIWDEHFMFELESGPIVDRIGHPEIQEIVLDIRPSVTNIADAIIEGELDGSAISLGYELSTSDVVDDRESINSTRQTTQSIYHIGFNLRRSPFLNLGFRQSIGAIIDRKFILEEIFDGAAVPTLVPYQQEELIPNDLHWDSENTPFIGEAGTGDIPVEETRDMFRDAGFQYDEDGSLLAR